MGLIDRFLTNPFTPRPEVEVSVGILRVRVTKNEDPVQTACVLLEYLLEAAVDFDLFDPKAKGPSLDQLRDMLRDKRAGAPLGPEDMAMLQQSPLGVGLQVHA